MALRYFHGEGDYTLSDDKTEATFQGVRTLDPHGHHWSRVTRKALKVRDQYAEWWEYVLVDGDIMHDLAGAFLGDHNKYWELYYMNPQLISHVSVDRWMAEGFTRGVDYVRPGEKIYFSRNLIPALERDLGDVADDDLTVFIDGELMPRPHRFSLEEHYDAICSAFEMVFSFDQNSERDRELFKPLKFKPCEIYIGPHLACLGVIEAVANSARPGEISCTIAGRTRSYIMQKTGVNPFMPAVVEGKKPKDIVNDICISCGLPLEIEPFANDAETGKPFAKFTLAHQENAFDVANRITRQRRLILGHNEAGTILLRRVDRSRPPIASLLLGDSMRQEESVSPTIKIKECDIRYDSTDLFATYIGTTQRMNSWGASNTLFQAYKNPLIQNERSIKYESFHDIEQAELAHVTSWEGTKAIREFFTGSLELEGWLVPASRKRWKTGELVVFEAPSVQMYHPHTMIIKAVKFEWVGNRKSSHLVIVPVEAFTGEEIASPPWAY